MGETTRSGIPKERQSCGNYYGCAELSPSGCRWSFEPTEVNPGQSYPIVVHGQDIGRFCTFCCNDASFFPHNNLFVICDTISEELENRNFMAYATAVAKSNSVFGDGTFL